ncbi:FkbM family methyltransferase, partial [Patescibacteria group bacterium]|nr:FkbM family methyltransferase [Patescibacteria group bacterium]
KGSWVGTQKSTSVTVQTHTLSEFITQPIDFLKMDIEGVEQKVLTTAVESLPLIEQMAIEFHTHKSQSLKKLVEFLEETHEVELYKGTKIVDVKKAKGLVIVVATVKSSQKLLKH